ncbi:somatostatin-1-like [Osmerus eperlanus]|uniref:somatostatin-1-like n=1 Tax=Osmerus eperlanus TaxID=29151 RepID=UPI002E15503A
MRVQLRSVLLLLAWSDLETLALPLDGGLRLQRHQDWAPERRGLLQQVLAQLSSDYPDSNQLHLQRDQEERNQERDQEERDQEERDQEARSLRAPPRHRFSCKNFFWKTYSIC